MLRRFTFAIATKSYGTSSQAAINAIIHANPALKDNPDRHHHWQNLRDPASLGSPVASAAPVEPARITTADRRKMFTWLKKATRLWSIARDEVGNAGAVAAIKELNKDVLQGSDKVRANIKLRLPAKSVSSGT